MMKKRLTLNLFMIAMLALLYNTDIIPLMLHEITGIGIFVLFGIHIWMNRTWKAKPSERTITLLLGAAFASALVSGIVISHELFPGPAKAPQYWLTIHVAAALSALLLTAGHAIQHRKSLLALLGKRKEFKSAVAIVLLCLTAFLALRTGMLVGELGGKAAGGNGPGILHGTEEKTGEVKN